MVTHGLDFLARGLRPYRLAPPLFEVFWSALVVLDALTVILLLSGRRKAGLALAVAIMLVDVGANSVVQYGGELVTLGWKLQLQSLFLGFLIGSVAYLWPKSDSPSIAAQP